MADVGPPLWGCALHATIGKTCCQGTEVLVTAGDRARISAAIGRDDWYELRSVDDPAYFGQDDDPNWTRWGFLPDGTRPVVKHRDNRDCTFLGPQGCSLATEVRPLVCRLFPYEYTERGFTGLSAMCPGHVIPPGRAILDLIGLRRPDAERWHTMLYDELRSGRHVP